MASVVVAKSRNFGTTRRLVQCKKQLAAIKKHDGTIGPPCLHTPTFVNPEFAASLAPAQGDAVVATTVDKMYGTTNMANDGSAGGDFAAKVVMGVGFLNDGKCDGDAVDLTDPNVRAGAAVTIYQSTKVGHPYIFGLDEMEPDEKKVVKARTLTTPFPQTNISLVRVEGDLIQLGGRQGIDLISYYDGRRPAYGTCGGTEAGNEGAKGIRIMYGNKGHEQLQGIGAWKGKDERNLYKLQSMVKGDNLMKTIEEVINRQADLTATVNSMITNQQTQEGTQAAHVHIASGFGAPTAPSIELAASVLFKGFRNVINWLESFTTGCNCTITKVNASKISYQGILSDHHTISG